MSFFNPRFLIPLALITGFLSSYGVYKYLQVQQAKLDTQTKRINVVIAADRCFIGHILTKQDMALKEYPDDILPEGTSTDLESLVGRVLKTDIVPGEPILESKLAPAGSAGGVTSMIPPGMRAMTVSVNIVSGVGGFILPNSKVDVMATVNATDTRNRTTTKIILQDVKVLAIDQTYQKRDTEPITVQSVTLLVTPEQGEKLALASQEGKLQLVLRNEIDQEEYASKGVRLDQLMTEPQPAAPATTARSTPRPAPVVQDPPDPPEQKPRVVEFIRSNERSEITFEPQSENEQ